jgi:hypothetical protein
MAVRIDTTWAGKEVVPPEFVYQKDQGR